MLNDLSFVMGAVARKDYVPELTHFRIQNGRVEAFNGQLAMSTPTSLDMTVYPKAARFIKAIERIPNVDDVSMHVTKAGRLAIKSGAYRAYVECLDNAEGFPELTPEGKVIELGREPLIPVLKTLVPFIGIDASRPWCRSVLLRGQSAFATNNITVVEYWMPDVFPVEVAVPTGLVHELIRQRVEPTSLQYDDGSVTFHYQNGAWIRSALLTDPWPDVGKLLNRPGEPVAFPVGFFEALERLTALTDEEKYVYLSCNTISTSQEAEQGASVELQDFDGVGCYHINQLAALQGVATKMEFKEYPRPCLFFGERTRGAIIGVRK